MKGCKDNSRSGKRLMAWMCVVGVVAVVLGAVIVNNAMEKRKTANYSIRGAKVRMQSEDSLTRP